MRKITKLISTELRECANLDIVCHTLDDMLRAVPDARIIRLEVYTLDPEDLDGL